MALTNRERKIVLFGGGGLVLFLLLYLVVPFFFNDNQQTTTVGEQRSDLAAIMHLYKDFENVKASYETIEGKINSDNTFSILTELENLAAQSQIKSNIEAMESKTKPKNEFFLEQAVEVRLIKITLKQLLTFLYSIEYSPKVLRVKKLHLESRFDNADLLNAQIEVSTFKPLEKVAE